MNLDDFRVGDIVVCAPYDDEELCLVQINKIEDDKVWGYDLNNYIEIRIDETCLRG